RVKEEEVEMKSTFFPCFQIVSALAIAFAFTLGSRAQAAPHHCTLGGENRFIEDTLAPSARRVCLNEGKVLCQLDGAFDPWCQEQKDGSVSVACQSQKGALHCCTGWAGSGLPHEDAKCRPEAE